jgi:glutamate synthase (NADPH/NADH) large chain
MRRSTRVSSPNACSLDMLPAITRHSGGEWHYEVKNFNRSIGARVSGEIARHWGNYRHGRGARWCVHLTGSIGQSFGVWNAGGPAHVSGR